MRQNRAGRRSALSEEPPLKPSVVATREIGYGRPAPGLGAWLGTGLGAWLGTGEGGGVLTGVGTGEGGGGGGGGGCVEPHPPKALAAPAIEPPDELRANVPPSWLNQMAAFSRGN